MSSRGLRSHRDSIQFNSDDYHGDIDGSYGNDNIYAKQYEGHGAHTYISPEFTERDLSGCNLGNHRPVGKSPLTPLQG